MKNLYNVLLLVFLLLVGTSCSTLFSGLEESQRAFELRVEGILADQEATTEEKLEGIQEASAERFTSMGEAVDASIEEATSLIGIVEQNPLGALSGIAAILASGVAATNKVRDQRRKKRGEPTEAK